MYKLYIHNSVSFLALLACMTLQQPDEFHLFALLKLVLLACTVYTVVSLAYVRYA